MPLEPTKIFTTAENIFNKAWIFAIIFGFYLGLGWVTGCLNKPIDKQLACMWGKIKEAWNSLVKFFEKIVDFFKGAGAVFK
jgi:hypothetical protein